MDLHDRQNSQRHAERTISPEGGRHLLSCFHLIQSPFTWPETGMERQPPYRSGNL